MSTGFTSYGSVVPFMGVSIYLTKGSSSSGVNNLPATSIFPVCLQSPSMAGKVEMELLPFVMMMVLECAEVGSMTLVKAAMNNGMSQLVYVVYSNALATLLLLPFFAIHKHALAHRRNWPPITLTLLLKFFILGFFGIGLMQPLAYAGINYSSPTLATALGNLVPAYTFLLAIIFRMEKLDVRSSSSLAKLIGTVIAISGASMLTFYKGPQIFQMTGSLDSPIQLPLSHQSNWILGGVILVISGILSSTWNVFQTAVVREYPDEITVVFLVLCFGTIQCTIFSFVMERSSGAWVLRSSISIISVVFGAVFVGAFRYYVITWCLNKKGPVYVAMFKPISMVIAVIMGVMFLGDTLHLGSAIGAVIIALGFYTMTWGEAKEKKNSVVEAAGAPGQHACPKVLFQLVTK